MPGCYGRGLAPQNAPAFAAACLLSRDQARPKRDARECQGRPEQPRARHHTQLWEKVPGHPYFVRTPPKGAATEALLRLTLCAASIPLRSLLTVRTLAWKLPDSVLLPKGPVFWAASKGETKIQVCIFGSVGLAVEWWIKKEEAGRRFGGQVGFKATSPSLFVAASMDTTKLLCYTGMMVVSLASLTHSPGTHMRLASIFFGSLISSILSLHGILLVLVSIMAHALIAVPVFTIMLALFSTLAVLACLSLYETYHAFICLGPGSVPPSFSDYIRMASGGCHVTRAVNGYLLPLPVRQGPTPYVYGTAPHVQINQHSPEDVQMYFADRFALFADLQPTSGAVLTTGWGEVHPLAGKGLPNTLALVYAPREYSEVCTVMSIIEASAKFLADVDLRCIDEIQIGKTHCSGNKF
ncbi:hypothetical protein Q7P37_009067 [Cladosporium fusiforme]